MPLYEFICSNEKCKEVFDEKVDYGVDKILCRTCNHYAIRNPISIKTGTIYKGSGWHKTDYKKGK